MQRVTYGALYMHQSSKTLYCVTSLSRNAARLISWRVEYESLFDSVLKGCCDADGNTFLPQGTKWTRSLEDFLCKFQLAFPHKEK